MAKLRGKLEAATDSLFLGSKVTADGDCSHEIRPTASWQESYDKATKCVEKQRQHFANVGPYSQRYGFPSGHVRLWELDRKEGRVPKNWCPWTVVLEKTLESPLDSKEIKPVNLKGNQPWILTGRIDVEAEAPVFWSPDAESWLTGKDPDAGKDGGQKEKRASEDEMARWHHWCNGPEFGQNWEMLRGEETWAAISLWGHKELDMAGWLNNNDKDNRH